jgi:putative redox protein
MKDIGSDRMLVDHVIAEVTSEAGDEHWLVHIATDRFELLSDASEAEGGGASGPGPYAYVLAGLVACTSGTLRMYAEHQFMGLHHVEVDAKMVERSDGSRAIEREIRLIGTLDQEDREVLLAQPGA